MIDRQVVAPSSIPRAEVDLAGSIVRFVQGARTCYGFSPVPDRTIALDGNAE